MGEVWRARDPRLGREVALKVLQADVSHDEEWRRRFEREARSAASLSHPHVCAVYDVGREGTRDYLVLELLEGETLEARLERGALPYPEVLRLGAQIAAALAAAHASGLIHRDLKPGNVMLVSAGVKLLDFGLAKLVLEAAPSAGNTLGSTAGMGLTRHGSLLGTVPYMSPEQAAGKPVDARSDIFALGAVLYEMATGERAFPGQTSAEVLSAILTRDPPAISKLRPATPAGFDRLVAGCLAKDPADRWDSAHDLSIRLRTPEVEVGPSGEGASRAPRRRAVAAALFVGVLLGAVGALLIRSPAPTPEPASPVHLLQPPPTGTKIFNVPETSSIAVSPDGKRIAFVAYRSGLARSAWMLPEGRQVWVRNLSEPEAHPVPFTEDATSVFWSPDGTALGFVVPGAMKRVNLDGAIPVLICPMGPGALASWGPDGNIVFTRLVEAALFQVPAAGGEPRPLFQPDRSSGDTAYSWPVHLPNGWLLFLARRGDGTYRLMMAKPGEPPRPLMPVSSKVQFTEPGLLVFVRDGALLTQRFDLRSQKLVGEPWAIASHVRNFASNASAEFATSAGGTLVWQPADSVGSLTWFDRAGHSLGRLGEDGSWRAVSISPDGESVACSRARPDTGVFDLWSFDISRGLATPIAPNRFTENLPVWHPSGAELVFTGAERGVPNLRRLNLATGEVVELRPSGTFQIPRRSAPMDAPWCSPSGRGTASSGPTRCRSGPARSRSACHSRTPTPGPCAARRTDMTWRTSRARRGAGSSTSRATTTPAARCGSRATAPCWPAGREEPRSSSTSRPTGRSGPFRWPPTGRSEPVFRHSSSTLHRACPGWTLTSHPMGSASWRTSRRSTPTGYRWRCWCTGPRRRRPTEARSAPTEGDLARPLVTAVQASRLPPP